MWTQGGAVVLLKRSTILACATLSLHALCFTSSSSSSSRPVSHDAHMSLWHIYSLKGVLIYYYQIPDILNFCTVLSGLVRVTAEVICIITTASAVSTAITRHRINITLRSGKIKSNPSLQRLSAGPRCLPVSHINSVSPSLTGRCRSNLSANEGEMLRQAGLMLS